MIDRAHDIDDQICKEHYNQRTMTYNDPSDIKHIPTWKKDWETIYLYQSQSWIKAKDVIIAIYRLSIEMDMSVDDFIKESYSGHRYKTLKHYWDPLNDLNRINLQIEQREIYAESSRMQIQDYLDWLNSSNQPPPPPEPQSIAIEKDISFSSLSRRSTFYVALLAFITYTLLPLFGISSFKIPDFLLMIWMFLLYICAHTRHSKYV